MDKYLINVWSSDRKVRKLFMSSPIIEAVIEKAATYGIHGSKLVLENNGSDICENDVLQYIINNNPQAIFLLLNEAEQWISAENINVSPENENIPWHKMPCDVLEKLKNKSMLGKRLNVVPNTIVDELRGSYFYILMSVFRAVAQKAAELYSDSIIEKDNEDQFLTVEPLALITKMRNRNNTFNREPKRSINKDLDIDIKDRKQANISDNSDYVIKYKKAFLNNLHKKKTITTNERNNVENYMTQCFAPIRIFLNNTKDIPGIVDILNEWPYLFDKLVLKQHFKILMEIDIDVFKTNFYATRNNIIKFLHGFDHQNIEISDFTNLHILKLLCKYFKEDINYILKEFDFGTTLDEVKREIPTNTPWAAIIKSLDPANNEMLIYLFVERKEVMNESSDVIQTLQNIICLFYVLNIMYPKEISQVMEFLVRFLIKHYPESVRKAKKQ